MLNKTNIIYEFNPILLTNVYWPSMIQFNHIKTKWHIIILVIAE